MNYTKLDSQVQRLLYKIVKDYAPLHDIIQAIDKIGGKIFLVGGAVRDVFLGKPIKDVDIEVHGLSLSQLETVLKQFGPVSTVGKVYGVLRLHGLDVDFSVPRSDAPGRKPHVTIDPFMSLKEAFSRRDLTMNAMGIDLMSFELIDPFEGIKDIKAGILRVPDSSKFIEDPLRFYRVMQFIARFDMKPDKELNTLCKGMDISSVSKERVEQECKKWLLKSKKPSVALDWLDDIGRLVDVFPEVAALKGVEQNPTWHPEGDVFEHTKQALDAAALMEYANEDEKLKIMYAILCHDFGKVSTTEKKDNGITSYGHEIESEKLAKKFLKRITSDKDLITTVCALVRYHMQPMQLVDGGAKRSAYKRLANKLAPYATLAMLAKVALADRQGRNKERGKPLSTDDQDIDAFLKKAHEADVLAAVEKPILTGKDVIDIVEPGPKMGALLKRAYEIQIEEDIKDKDELKKRVLDIM